MVRSVYGTSYCDSTGRTLGANPGPDPTTPSEKSVHFINGEVLDPPEQGKLSFVGPYFDQSLAMAVEDARSFVQGAEQILLVALAKALAKALGDDAPAPLATDNLNAQDRAPQGVAPAADDMNAKPEPGPEEASPSGAVSPEGAAKSEPPETEATNNDSKDAGAPKATNGEAAANTNQIASDNLKSIESMMACLSSFHASVTDTAIRYKGRR